MKLCKDCKHAERETKSIGWFWGKPLSEVKSYAKCLHPLCGGTHLVTGNTDPQYCNVMRLSHKECGEDAKLWEPVK